MKFVFALWISICLTNVWGFSFFKNSRQVVPKIEKQSFAPITFSKSFSEDAEFVAEIQVKSPSPGDFSKDGMQVLTYESLEKTIGSQVRGISMAKLSIWTSSADSLAEVVPVDITNPTELFQEVGAWRRDANNNGIFDEGDSLIFFGHGSSIWQKVEDPSYPLKFQLSHSPWGDFQSYYLGVLKNGTGLTLDTLENLGTVNDTLMYLWNYRHAEREVTLRDDVYGKGESYDDSTGVEWHWIYIVYDDHNSYQVNHPNMEGFPMYAGDSAYAWTKYYPIRGTGSAAPSKLALGEAYRFDGVKYNFYINGQLQPAVPLASYKGKFLNQLTSLTETSRSFSIQLDPASFASSDSRFDSYTIAYKAPLNFSDKQPYILNHQVFNQSVGIPFGQLLPVIKIVNHEAKGLLPFEGGLYKDFSPSESTQYFVWDGSFQTPEILPIDKASNEVIQNLSDLSSQSASYNNLEYLIISPSSLSDKMVELAQLRSSGKLMNRLNTAVVRVEDIYQRYSGGRPSPVAIRDYLRYVKSIVGDSFQHLLLVGDTHYDFRNILNKNVSLNVPTYQREDYSTDDFYALLDAGEVLSIAVYDIDLNVGRLPVNSTEDIQDYITKLKNYSESGVMNQGFWRSQTLLTADDFAQNGILDDIGSDHMKNSEKVSNVIQEELPWMNLTKIYIADYEIDASFQKPTAAQDLVRKLDYGQFLFNYFGHGSTDQIADENLLNDISINQLKNSNKTPIFTAFSCTVGRVDRISGTTLTQELMATSNHGAIAAIAATRKTYNSFNASMSTIFFENLMNLEEDLMIGEAIRKTKNELANGPGNSDSRRWGSEKYILLGEPVLTIPKERLTIQFDSLPDTLQALQKVKLSGQVTGSVPSGKIYLKVNEQASNRTFVNEFRGGTVPVQISGKTLYAEVLDFKDGKFSTEFITPRKISFGDSNAVVTAYAWQDKQVHYGTLTKTGVSLNGTSDDAADIQDNEAPVINAYPCDLEPSTTGLYDKEIQLSSPSCVEFEVTDETGIDLSEEVDEGVTVSVSDIYPRQHANFEILQGKRATFRLELGAQVAPGEYDLEVRALDIMGNFAKRNWTLVLSNDTKQNLADVYNVPNPMRKKTRFFFKTNPGSDVTVKIFDQNGRLVNTLRNVISGVTTFNGRDRYGRRLANGVYFYKVISERTNSQEKKVEESRLEKLLISR